MNEENEEKEDKEATITYVVDYCNHDVERVIKSNEAKGYEPNAFEKHFIETKVPLVDGDIDDTAIVMIAVDRVLADIKRKLTVTRELNNTDSTCGTREYKISFKK